MTAFCDYPIRVRYAETDQMGVAYYANYLIWFEVGRSEFCRQHGFSYGQMEREAARFLIVAEARCRYHRSLRYDQEFVVRTSLKELRKRTITFAYQLLDPETRTLFAEGETLHVVADKNGHPKSFPQEFRRYFVDD